MRSLVRIRSGKIWMLSLAALGAVALAQAPAAPSKPAAGGPGAPPSVRNRFIGVWKLVSFERKANNGDVTYPYGESPVGRITYDRAGRMSAQLMRPGRRQAGTTLRDAAVDDLREAVNGFIAYFGTYDIDEATRTVIHHVQACLIPSWVGTDLRRTYEFSGNRLILTVKSEQGVGRLVWEREPD